MKMLIAIIQPTKLKAVQEALRRIGVSRLTVSDAMGFARQRGDVLHRPQVAFDPEDRRQPGLEVNVRCPQLAGGGEHTIEDLTHRSRTSEGITGLLPPGY